MEQQEIIASIEARVRRLRINSFGALNMGEICRRAGLHPTTFSRWKKSERNPNPVGATMKSIEKIEAVIAEEERALASPEPTEAEAA